MDSSLPRCCQHSLSYRQRQLHLAQAAADCNSDSNNNSNNNSNNSSRSKAERLKQLQAEIEELQQSKQQQIDMSRNPEWREQLREELELEISRRVREALDTPPGERHRRNRELARVKAKRQQQQQQQQAAAAAVAAAAAANGSSSGYWLQQQQQLQLRQQRWQLAAAQQQQQQQQDSFLLSRQLQLQQEATDRAAMQQQWPANFSDSDSRCSSSSRSLTFAAAARIVQMQQRQQQQQQQHLRTGLEAMRNFGDLSDAEKRQLLLSFTKEAFREAERTGRLPDGSPLLLLPDAKFKDQFGIVRHQHGPFWPRDFGPCVPAPQHRRLPARDAEPLLLPLRNPGSEPEITADNQQTQFTGKWRGTQIVFDSEKCACDHSPPQVSPDVCPSIRFESRFESGNLRQARRVGMYEYELVLRTDLYTRRHTQWFYFRVDNTLPGIVYKFVILNLLKPSSLYSEGMKPLMYSQQAASSENVGWLRSGHHISYVRNITRRHAALLHSDIVYFQLEWQMEFHHSNDTCYIAHSYPYTFSDLRDDLLEIRADSSRSKFVQQEVMCETRAGNACYLLTVTDPDSADDAKRGVMITARVHPGESNSSWMMKGVIDFLSGSSAVAANLRRHFVFKIIPMLNPDGVIVGNYRTSLAARDLNRNYRHPRKEAFPTIFHTKLQLQQLQQQRQVVLYCDLHGHSRKPNVFMYGCDAQYRSVQAQQVNSVKLKLQPKAFLNERLFPWLMSRCAPQLFSFSGCKFNIRRCKESTGRVVVWRQFEIANSFTMEATFSGTSVSSSNSRHFNTLDLESMGSSLGAALWQYKQVKEDATMQSQVVVDMTCQLVVSQLQARGISVTAMQVAAADSGAAAGAAGAAAANDDDKANNKDSTLNLLRAAISSSSSSGESNSDTKAAAERIEKLLDQISLQTIDDCSDVLQKLNLDAAAESDSSDSDSESEPEMPPEPAKKKKKKSKRRELGGKRRDSREVERTRRRLVIPAATATCLHSVAAITEDDVTASYSDQQQQQQQQQQQRRKDEECSSRSRVKQYPMFVSKFEGRSNKGIPCFAQERLLERANKKIFSLHSQLNRDRSKDVIYSNLTDDMSEATRNLASLEDIGFRLRHFLLEDSANNSEADEPNVCPSLQLRQSIRPIRPLPANNRLRLSLAASSSPPTHLGNRSTLTQAASLPAAAADAATVAPTSTSSSSAAAACDAVNATPVANRYRPGRLPQLRQRGRDS